MKESIKIKLASLVERLEEFDRQLADPAVVNNMDNYRKITKEAVDEIAAAQGLNMTQLQKDMESPETAGMSYMSCHGFIRAKRKIFIAPVIVAASARDDEMARAYAQ